MTRDEAVTRIQRILAFRTGLTTEIQDAIKDAQVDLEKEHFLPWFLLTDGDTPTDISTVADQRYIDHPTGFIRELDDDGLWYVDSDGASTELEKHESSYLLNTYGVQEGAPKAYAQLLDTFNLYPLPDAVYTVRLHQYYKADTVLSSDVTNQWLTYAPGLIIAEAGLLMPVSVRPGDITKDLLQRQARGKAELIRSNTAREQENRKIVMGGPD